MQLGIDLDPWYCSWKELWQQIEGDLNTLRIHVVTTRFQLEMRKEQGSQKADEVTRQILVKLPPNAALEDAERFAAEYRIAYREVEEPREHPTWFGIFKGLLLSLRTHRRTVSQSKRRRNHPVEMPSP